VDLAKSDSEMNTNAEKFRDVSSIRSLALKREKDGVTFASLLRGSVSANARTSSIVTTARQRSGYERWRT